MWVRARQYTGRVVTVSNSKARKHSVEAIQMGHEALAEMRRRYFMESPSTEPRVYWRLTDNRLELTVRFVVREHGVRDFKDRMSREILHALDEAGGGLASTTFELVGVPDLRVGVTNAAGTGRA
jgi:hypothetical protein